MSARSKELVKAAGWYPRRRGLKPAIEKRHPVVIDGVVAGAVAGVLSGVPSTVHALLTGGDPLAAARAAGNLLLPADGRPAALLAAGAVAHVGLSLGWGTFLAVAVRRLPVLSSAAPAATAGGTLPVPGAVVLGVVAGAAIAAVDLGVAHGRFGRRWPLVRALPVWPQVADHLAFGAVAGAVLGGRRRRCRGDMPRPPGLHRRG